MLELACSIFSRESKKNRGGKSPWPQSFLFMLTGADDVAEMDDRRGQKERESPPAEELKDLKGKEAEDRTKVS